MIISDTAVKKNTAVAVLAIILVIAGVSSYFSLPRENEPDITIPNVLVTTSYRGVSSTEVETAITIEIERKLKGLEGVKTIHSVSSAGVSTIDIEFIIGTDIKQALQEVRVKVDEALDELPADLEDKPEVAEVNLSEMPIIVYSLSGSTGVPSLKKIADDLKDEIESVPGVLEAEIIGGLEREIRLELDPDKLAFYRISVRSLEDIIHNENQNSSGGSILLGKGRFQLRVPGAVNEPEELLALVVGVHQGCPVYLKDVARVIDGFKDETSRSRLNGRPAVNIAVKKRAGENIISISNEVDRIIADLQPGWPLHTRITKVMDKASDIRRMVSDLENNILTGLLLVLVIIFIVMDMRNGLLVSLAIPFSMLLSFTFLSLLGITLNMVVLFSLTLALGMLVDNGIVIVENIHRYIELGHQRKEAVRLATSEVASPVICSTLTTLAAFSPLLFWPDTVGEFMRYLPLTLIVTLSSSLFVSLVILPAFASFPIMIGGGQGNRSAKKGLSEKKAAVAAAIHGFLRAGYAGTLNYALDNGVTVILTAIGCLVLTVQGWLLVVGLERPVEFFPSVDPKGMYVNLRVPEGSSIDYIDTIIHRVELALSDASAAVNQVFSSGLPEPEVAAATEEDTGNHQKAASHSDMQNIKHVYTRAAGKAESGSEFDDMSPNHVAVNFIDLAKRQRSSMETVDEIRERVRYIPGAEITVGMEEEGPPTGEPVCIEVSGDDFLVLGRIAQSVKERLVTIPNVQDVRDNFVESVPSIQVLIDRQKAALLGLNTDDIARALKSGYNGLEVSSFLEKDNEYDITLRLAESNRRILDSLNSLMIPASSGYLVPLSSVTRISLSGSVGDITRINHRRVVVVEASVDETETTGSVVRAQAEALLHDLHLPAGYRVDFSGEFEAEEESQEFLIKAFISALLLIFLILVAMFNSIVQPFLVMASILLSLGGVFFGLMLFRAPFGIIMTGVGVISLAGVVVNNGIVLIDYTNKLRAQGHELRDAVRAAGITRLRPVLLTAVTTILGLLPMLTSISFDFHSWTISLASESSQWWRSMAIAMIFGLFLATFMTLFVVPTLYYLIGRLSPSSTGEETKRPTGQRPQPCAAGTEKQLSGSI